MVISAAAAHLTLLPIAPIILLPFILIFFVVVFPIWGVALGILGLVLLIARGVDRIVALTGAKASIAAPVYKAFRWVLTFGGFTEKGWRLGKKKAVPARTGGTNARPTAGRPQPSSQARRASGGQP